MVTWFRPDDFERHAGNQILAFLTEDDALADVTHEWQAGPFRWIDIADKLASERMDPVSLLSLAEAAASRELQIGDSSVVAARESLRVAHLSVSRCTAEEMIWGSPSILKTALRDLGFEDLKTLTAHLGAIDPWIAKRFTDASSGNDPEEQSPHPGEKEICE